MSRDPDSSLTGQDEVLVPIPDDVVSEESDFHGSSEDRRRYNKLAASYNPAQHWATHDWAVQVIAAKGKEARHRAAAMRKMSEEDQRQHADPCGKSVGANDDNTLSVAKDDGVEQGTEPSPAALAVDGDDPLRRPKNYYEGNKMAKQLSESLADFLTRLPPASTTIADGGPWVWIANPFPARDRRISLPESGDIGSFKQAGFDLLERYRSRKAELERQNPGKPPATITRKLYPDRLRLESDILQLARKSSVMCGKWMFFPTPDQVDRVWATVAKGVWEGQLGIAAKVATGEPARGGLDTSDDEAPDPRAIDPSTRLICVYTHDFSDKADVRRVLRGLRRLGLLDQGPRAEDGHQTIYYKCDAYSYLDIARGNEYKLRAKWLVSRFFLALTRQH